MTESNNVNYSALYQAIKEAWAKGFQAAIDQMRELAADPAVTDPHSRRHMETIARLLMAVKPD